MSVKIVDITKLEGYYYPSEDPSRAYNGGKYEYWSELYVIRFKKDNDTIDYDILEIHKTSSDFDFDQLTAEFTNTHPIAIPELNIIIATSLPAGNCFLLHKHRLQLVLDEAKAYLKGAGE